MLMVLWGEILYKFRGGKQKRTMSKSGEGGNPSAYPLYETLAWVCPHAGTDMLVMTRW